MKKIVIIFLFILIQGISYGGNPRLIGKYQTNIGIGLSEYSPPVYFGIENYLLNDITIGMEVSYRSSNTTREGKFYRENIIGFSANGNYHFNEMLDLDKEWDLYSGLNAGYYYWYSPNSNEYFNSNIGIGFQIGGRYYFNEYFGVNAEIGAGNAFNGGKFGFSFRF